MPMVNAAGGETRPLKETIKRTMKRMRKTGPIASRHDQENEKWLDCKKIPGLWLCCLCGIRRSRRFFLLTQLGRFLNDFFGALLAYPACGIINPALSQREFAATVTVFSVKFMQSGLALFRRQFSELHTRQICRAVRVL